MCWKSLFFTNAFIYYCYRFPIFGIRAHSHSLRFALSHLSCTWCWRWAGNWPFCFRYCLSLSLCTCTSPGFARKARHITWFGGRTLWYFFHHNLGSVSMLVGSKSGVSSVSRGTRFDWLSHQGPPISGTQYTRYCIACFALLGCIMDKFLLNIYKIYHL